MKIPKNVPNCSPGLESLSMLDQLFIKRGVCLTLKAYSSFGRTYKFVVKNKLGEGVRSLIEFNFPCIRFKWNVDSFPNECRCIGPSRKLIAVVSFVSVRFDRLISKFGTFIRMKSSISIDHWPVRAAVSHAVVCKRWKYHLHLAKSLAVLLKHRHTSTWISM